MANVTFVEVTGRQIETYYVRCKSRAEARRYCEAWNGRYKIALKEGWKTEDEIKHYIIADKVDWRKTVVRCALY